MVAADVFSPAGKGFQLLDGREPAKPIQDRGSWSCGNEDYRIDLASVWNAVREDGIEIGRVSIPFSWDDWDGESFQKNKLTWYIGSLDPDETVSLVIWLKTLKNPAGKYEPTSESQDLEIQLSDKGAKVVAEALCGKLTAVTEPIVLAIEDIEPGVENAVAVIGTELPYSTPHAEDSCP